VKERQKATLAGAWRVLLALCLLGCGPRPGAVPGPGTPQATLALPPAMLKSTISLEEAISARRSIREFTSQALTLEELGQLLWSAQGITDPRGFRTAPSAGALYPLELYVVLEAGVYRYKPVDHEAELIQPGDSRRPLAEAALREEAVQQAPAVFVLAAVYERTAARYGAERSIRYVDIEVGHAAQNLLLQAVALDLGAVPIGAFHDEEVQQVLGLPGDHRPLYLIPVGHPAQSGDS
jgi:SagB-type dehydrogenase family enzyme